MSVWTALETVRGAGHGGGIVASMAFDHGRDKGLRAVEASHLFAPELKRADIDRVVHGNSDNGCALVQASAQSYSTAAPFASSRATSSSNSRYSNGFVI